MKRIGQMLSSILGGKLLRSKKFISVAYARFSKISHRRLWILWIDCCVWIQPNVSQHRRRWTVTTSGQNPSLLIHPPYQNTLLVMNSNLRNEDRWGNNLNNFLLMLPSVLRWNSVHHLLQLEIFLLLQMLYLLHHINTNLHLLPQDQVQMVTINNFLHHILNSLLTTDPSLANNLLNNHEVYSLLLFNFQYLPMVPQLSLTLQILILHITLLTLIICIVIYLLLLN